jgi:hypothetical protein
MREKGEARDADYLSFGTLMLQNCGSLEQIILFSTRTMCTAVIATSVSTFHFCHVADSFCAGNIHFAIGTSYNKNAKHIHHFTLMDIQVLSAAFCLLTGARCQHTVLLFLLSAVCCLL